MRQRPILWSVGLADSSRLDRINDSQAVPAVTSKLNTAGLSQWGGVTTSGADLTTTKRNWSGENLQPRKEKEGRREGGEEQPETGARGKDKRTDGWRTTGT